jgi:hypothetical protein
MTPPVSGISLFISLIILGIGGFLKYIRRIFNLPPRSGRISLQTSVRYQLGIVIVGLSVCMSIIVSITFVTIATASQHNNLSLLADIFTQCEPFPKQPLGDRLVILRLDDVQAYGWTDISITMMEDAFAADMPVVAGTIAKGVSSDPTLNRFFQKHYCKIEVALHGYDHGIGGAITYERDGVAEFENLTTYAARRQLSLAMAEINALPVGRITTFIPPQNKISEPAKNVLSEYGLYNLSSEGNGVFDYHTATWNFTTGDYVYAKQVVADCEARFAAGNRLCVIMLHPQDYALSDASLNTELYRDFGWLLSELQRADMQAVTFQDLDQDPQWRYQHLSEQAPEQTIATTSVAVVQ